MIQNKAYENQTNQDQENPRSPVRDAVIIESLDDLKRMFIEAIEMDNERKKAKKKVAAMKVKPKKINK